MNGSGLGINFHPLYCFCQVNNRVKELSMNEATQLPMPPLEAGTARPFANQ
jgi:hypothetical protein